MGWRLDAGGSPYAYLGYYNPGWVFKNYGGISGTHDYQLEHKTSDNKWYVFLDGNEKDAIPLSVSGGWMLAGGEVTDCDSSVHNAMGVSGLQNLSYMVNHTGYYAWSNFWGDSTRNYSYQNPTISYNSFKDYGYNP